MSKPASEPMWRRTRALGWLVVLGAVLAALHLAGAGPLAPPPADPSEWVAWAGGREPLLVAAALARIVALAVGWWLLTTTALVLAADVLRSAALDGVVRVLSPGVVRRALSGTVTLSIGLAPSALAAAEASPPPTMVLLDDDDEAEPSTTTTPVPPPPAAPVTPPPARTPSTTPTPTVTLGQGDHLWTVAERALTDAWHRTPSEAELVPYWRTLVEANRSSLADPANPDLVFPGQVVRLPPAPAVPG